VDYSLKGCLMVIKIQGYEIVRELGEGGMGIVYLAKEENLDTLVAIKLLHRQYSSKEEIRERFKNEARMMSALVHTNIVQFRHFLALPEGLALVMEYVEGRGLDRMIGEEFGPIPYEKALPIFKQVLQGVGYAHSKGVVHRDIKPSNIIVSEFCEVKVADFGIAKIAGQTGLTRTGMQMGTLYYESPEQIRGAKDVDQRSDIYSLGMTLYEMLAGRLPFEAENNTSEFEITQQIVFKENPSPDTFYPHIPAWLVGIVNKATVKEPDDRFQSCEEFLRCIDAKSASGIVEGTDAGGKTAAVYGLQSEASTVIERQVPEQPQFAKKNSKKGKYLIPVIILAVLVIVFLVIKNKDSNSGHSEGMQVSDTEMDEADESADRTSHGSEEQADHRSGAVDSFDPVDTIRPGVISALASSCRNRLIQEYELDDLSYREIKLVRNYFYAYYNRPFDVLWIREYFIENMNGYRPTGDPDPVITDIERDNIDIIMEYESVNNIPVINY
jgi:serine/threonine protein kinase